VYDSSIDQAKKELEVELKKENIKIKRIKI
jgi:hypothetical protein